MSDFLSKLSNPKVLGAFRHLLSTMGGVLSARGVVTQSEWELYTGVAFAVVALLMSLRAPEKGQ